MNRFEQNLQELQKVKSPQEFIAELMMEKWPVSPELTVVYEIIKESQKLSDCAQAAALVFGDSGPNDKNPEVYRVRCEVLEYLKLVNYGFYEFFRNRDMPGGEQNGDQ